MNNLILAIASALSGGSAYSKILGMTGKGYYKQNPQYHLHKSSFKQNRRIQLKKGFKARGK